MENILTENKPLPVSVGLLIGFIVALIGALIFVINLNNRVDVHDTEITVIKAQRKEDSTEISDMKILLVRIADKLGVDTRNPLSEAKKQSNLSNLFQ